MFVQDGFLYLIVTRHKLTVHAFLFFLKGQPLLELPEDQPAKKQPRRRRTFYSISSLNLFECVIVDRVEIVVYPYYAHCTVRF
jgi:hypothetical protein